jgi:hypothetical protein
VFLKKKTALAKVGWRAPDFHQQSSLFHQLASLFHQLASLFHQLALLTLFSPTFINIFTNSHLIFTNSHFDDITTSRHHFFDTDTVGTAVENATENSKSKSATTKEKSDENENQLHQVESDGQACPRPSAASTRSKLPSQRQRRSKHGLPEESKKAVQWVHQIPYYWKPLIPGIFNLCNSAMRWASLVDVPASIAENTTKSMDAMSFLSSSVASSNISIVI